MLIVDIIVLWIHIFCAIIFVGGSFFMWLVLWPASFKVTQDERERTLMVGRVAKRFAYFTHVTIATLVVTGIYNATWYLGGNYDLLATEGGRILLAKVILVGIMIFVIYFNNIYHGRKITRLAREGKIQEVQRIRRYTHVMSYFSLALMVAIIFLATSLQFF
ncbi:hypothetical protein GCM10007108_07080 [Thermogymnomonas acidicola]|uniref:Copper resistance protein D domain-containing protein n=1 Tax=Thermogymnomonas acidicola TaxID=399579 RepID=A0AA37BQZ7_9ARCH|nr:CopD family protein [Thermogymnomonas acidicola]GGM71557.1 hypothetical protein GCM10007108_07080 [Thermogymnomonas acidicola]